jgi:hypothetical protein
MIRYRWPLAMALLLASSLAAAVTLTSAAAGFAGTSGPYCYGNSNNFEIEIVYNVYSCERHGVIEFDVSSTGLTGASSALITLYDGAVGNSEAWYWTVDVYGYAGDGHVTGSDFNVGTYIGSATWFRYDPNADKFGIDVTDFVNAQLALGTAIVGFELRPNGEFNCMACSTAFTYFDGAGGDRPPTLTLQPVPAPAAGWLAGACAILVAPRFKARAPVPRATR